MSPLSNQHETIHVMNIHTVREEFTAIVGAERVHKFVMTLNKSPGARLLFWQEKIWEPFARERGLPESDGEEIRKYFLYCPVHGQELESDEVRVAYGTHGQRSDEDEYPFANDVALGPCWVGEEKTRVVQFCRQCRAVTAAKELVWNRRPEPPPAPPNKPWWRIW